jgi:oxygen-independent coproporphyrinogen-3 oxidase
MIVINFNKPEFEYDVHSMVKAYLPKEDVEMYYTCPLEEVEGKNVACTHREIENEDEETRTRLEDAEYIFYVDYLENKISIKWIIDGDKLFTRDFEVDFYDRKETKNALKQNLYDVLKEGTGRDLPWGTLTGIRPTKIPMKLMEEGISDEEIFQYMKETYFATDEKIQLSIDIAKRERKLLEKIDYENGYSLYIGIPFCPSTCLYCSFTSYPLGMWKNRE